MNGIENENGAPVRCGEWELVQEIGRGAYGVVYRALGPDGARAAVKVCRRGDVGDERCARELRGARLYRSIPQQEGLVRMRELVEADWGFYTVMDLADDEFGAAPERPAEYRPKTLARVIEGEKALPLKACVGLALSLAKGLAALQRHHLLHRDIKPGNVVYVGGKPVLSDPGLLVEASDAATLVGTPGYVPPERFTEAASDVYSLGLTLKAASFGRQIEELDKGPALEADTGAAFFAAWWRILNKATEAMPARRYQSAKALLKDLKALRLKTAVSEWRTSRRARVIALLVTGIVFVGVFALVEVRRNYDLKDLESVKEIKLVMQRASRLQAIADFLQKAYRSISAQTNASELRICLKQTKAYTRDTKLQAQIDSVRPELSELMKKGDEHMKSFHKLRKMVEEKSVKGLDVTQELQEIQMLMDDDRLLNDRIFEIANRFYEKWQPSPYRLR